MKPTEVSTELRRIASKISNSTNPSRELVSEAIRNVLAQLTVAALPKSNTGKQMLSGFLDEAKQALESGDDMAFKGAIEKLWKNA